VALLLGILFAGPAPAQSTELASISTDNVKANDDADGLRFHISADGRVVTFMSEATNLVAGDGNDLGDIFVRDRVAGTTTRVSIASDGAEANGKSSDPVLSGDGRFVAFSSFASNLVEDDTNATWDVFVHDRESSTTERVSVDSFGAQASGRSFTPAISGDGRFVAFISRAADLVAEDTNRDEDVFVHDRLTGMTERVSVDSLGNQGDDDSFDPAISADGRFVVFDSFAANLVEGDDNNAVDIFIHDRLASTTERVSLHSDGGQADSDSFDPAISADGRFVAFDSFAANLVEEDDNGAWDAFVHDRETGTTARVSLAGDGTQADSNSFAPVPSASGRHIAFYSLAGNLVSDDANGTWDVFLHDRETGTTERLSIATDGQEADGVSADPAVSADGRFVSFISRATNLSASDGDTLKDLYVRDRGARDNQPPIADAGPDRAVEASSAAGASVRLDAGASSDPDADDNLTYAWSGPFGTAVGMTPTVALPMGGSTVELSVTDKAGARDSDSAAYTVVDTTPPSLFVPPDIQAVATGSQTEVEIGEATATDLVDPAPIVTNDAPETFPPGTTLVAWTATDATGNSVTVSQTVSVGLAFMGFKRPVRALPGVNTVKAGRVIPVRWHISDGNGGSLSDPSVVQSLALAAAPTCDTGEEIGEVNSIRTLSGQKIRPEAKSAQFLYLWRTSRDLRGECGYLVLTLADGTSHRAFFKFR
jgi:Tol biopolymer transport system component